MGLDPVTMAMVGGMGIDAISNIFGAQSQAGANQANLAATQQHNAMLQGYVNNMMQTGTNPYSQALMSFLGRSAPSPQLGGGTLPAASGAPAVTPFNMNGIMPNFNMSPGGRFGLGPSGGTDLGGMIPTSGGGAGAQPGQMYNYAPVRAAQYNPMFAGAAPQFNAPQVGAPSMVGTSQVAPGQIGLPGSINPAQVAPGQLASPTPVGTQFFNTGQDALSQMLRSGPSVGLDPSAQFALQQQATNPAQFQNSDTAKALGDLANYNLQNQVDALHASAGSLGARFGTGMSNAEAQLRGSVQNNLNATLAPLYQQSFEAAQGRQLSAAQTLNQGALGLGGLQSSLYGTQLSGAQGLGSLAQQGNALSLQGQQANAANQLQAGQTNLSALMQAALANQQTGLSAQQQNAANSLQAGGLNLNALMQAQLANQQTGLSASQTNAANQLQLGGMNLGALMQAGLANQQMAGQFGLANANIFNQAGQFNAQNLNQMGQFNAQQGNVYNQFMTGILGQAAGLQNTQQQQNMGLLSLLAGLPIPQQQVSPYPAAIGNLGTTAAMIPFMNQILGQSGQGYGGAPSYLPPINPIGNYQPNTGSFWG